MRKLILELEELRKVLARKIYCNEHRFDLIEQWLNVNEVLGILYDRSFGLPTIFFDLDEE